MGYEIESWDLRIIEQALRGRCGGCWCSGSQRVIRRFSRRYNRGSQGCRTRRLREPVWRGLVLREPTC